MINRIRSTLEKDCRLNPSQLVLVAVSGGPDSLCLLDILWQLGYRMVIAHLDHELRPESKADAESVRSAAERMDLPFVTEQADVRAFAENHRLSLEEAARAVRYRFLFRIAEEQGAQAVAVGHTANDQVETILMHLLRGSGLFGLTGMDYRSQPNSWSRELPLVRPMLRIWREEIEAYLVNAGLQPVQDASNWDPRYSRNRLRHELLPYLESYNPHVRSLVWQMGDVLKQDQALLVEQTNAAWMRCVQDEGPGYAAFFAGQLRREPTGLQRRLLRRAIEALRPGLRDVDYQDIERALEFLDDPPRSSQLDLVAGLRLLLEGDKLWIAAWEADLPEANWPQISHGGEILLDAPGSIQLPGNWQLSIDFTNDLQASLQQAAQNPDTFQAWLDGDRLQLPVKIRARQPGDTIQPLGMGGHSIKISDLMINAKLPRRARRCWPLVVAGEKIAWVAGLRVGEEFSVTDETKRVIRLRLVQNQK